MPHGITERLLKNAPITIEIFLNENFNYHSRTPHSSTMARLSEAVFSIAVQALKSQHFIEGLIRLGKWTVSACLRWDHYQLLLNQNAFSPASQLDAIFHQRMLCCIHPRPQLSDAIV